MSSTKILKLRSEISKMQSVYSKSSTSDKTKAILKKAIDKAKGDIEKLQAKTAKPATKAKAAPAKPKTTKRKKSSPVDKLASLVKKKKYAAYQNSGIDLKKDASQGALPIGKRTSKSGGKYYEYRANRYDVKQPKKKQRYPKLEDGGMMAKGGDMYENFGNHVINAYGTLKDGTKVFIEYGRIMYPNTDNVPREGLYYVVKKRNGEVDYVHESEMQLPIKKEDGGMMEHGGELKVINLGGDRYDDGLVYEIRSGDEVLKSGVLNGNEMISYMGKKYDGLKALADGIGAKLEIAEDDDDMKYGGYMAKGGSVGVKEYKIVPMIELGVKGYITPDYKSSVKFKGTEDEAVAKAQEIANSNSNFVRVEVKREMKTKTITVGIVEGKKKNDGGVMASGGTITMLTKSMVEEINDSVKMGYDNVVTGMISPKTRGVMLINDESKVRGKYPIGLKDAIEQVVEKAKHGMMASGGDLLKEDDYVWNAVGKKLVVQKVTDDEYYLQGFMQHSSSPFSKKKVDDYIKTGHWSLKPKSIQMASGGKIKDQYEDREPSDIWDNMSKQQRQHFIYDHADQIENYRGEEYGELTSKEIMKAYNSTYDELDKHIKNRFNNHVREGQYKDGGMMDIDSFADGGELKKDYLVIFDSQTQEYQPTTFQSTSVYDLVETLKQTIPEEVEIISIEEMHGNDMMEYGGVAGY